MRPKPILFSIIVCKAKYINQRQVILWKNCSVEKLVYINI